MQRLSDWMELFPEDVLINILVRLPVKSLIRFTSVCKHWMCLIKSPEFVSKHYATRLRIQEDGIGYDSILTQYTPACSFTVFSYETLNCETAFKIRPAVLYDPPKLGVYHRDVIQGFQILGHCNGIFFVQLHRDGPAPAPAPVIPPLDTKFETVLLLWNLAIRQVSKIPSLLDDDEFRYGYLGFGFDSVTNDYKVVCFDGIDPYIASSVTKKLAVYSLAANCWRHLDVEAMNVIGYDSISIICYKSTNISTGRKSHWILTNNSYRAGTFDFLLSFDMVDEVFVQTCVPYDDRQIAYMDQGSNSMYPTIYTLDRQSRSDITVWVLKEYGPRGYWTKQHSVKIPPLLNMSLSPCMMLWNKSSSIVFFSNSRVHCYDLVTRQMKSLYFPADAGLVAYTESLVSVRPPAQRSDQQQQQQPPDADDQDEDENDNDDDDASSVDSAFLEPEEQSFRKTPPYCTDYEAERIRLRHAKKEWLKLVKLPYCIRELYQPINSNPCTF